MPITFEPAQPFAPSISAYYGSAMQNDADAPRLLAARQQAQANAMQGYGGGGGGGGGGGNSIQDAINQRDTNRMRADEFTAQLETGVQRDQFEAQVQGAAQRQRFDLQAQLQDVELSQQEKMRLQRMKNAVGEVSVDPTLTDQEKSDMILQLKTGIDPFQHRLATQKMQIDKLQKDAMVQELQSRAAIEQQTSKFRANSFEDNQRYVPHANVLAQYVEDEVTANPGIDPKQAEANARARAIKEGHYDHFIQESPGKWQRQDPRKGGDAEGGGTGGTRGSSAGGGGAEKPPKELDDVGIVRAAKARLEATGVTPDDPKYGDKLQAMANEVKAENKAKIDLSKQGGKPKPVDPEDKKVALDKISTLVTTYQNRTDLNPDVRNAAVAMIRQQHAWIEKYGDEEHFPPPVKREAAKLEKSFKQLVPPAPAPGAAPGQPVAGQQVPGQPPGVVYDENGNMGVWQQGPRTLRTDMGGAKNAIEGWQGRNRGRLDNADKTVRDWAGSLGSYLGVK